MTKLVTGLIRVYQLFISPMFPPSCRYYPTCSEYAIEAVQKKGVIKGSFLAVRRVLRCHPGCDGGFDPVPDSNNNTVQNKKRKLFNKRFKE